MTQDPIIGCDYYSENKLDSLIEAISKQIEKVNHSNALPFDLSASFGGILKHIDSIDEIDPLYQLADEKMYEMKSIHHKNKLS